MMERDGPCPICGEQTNCTAGNPAKWPIRLTKPDGTGVTHSWHTGCVQDILFGRKPPYVLNEETKQQRPHEPTLDYRELDDTHNQLSNPVCDYCKAEPVEGGCGWHNCPHNEKVNKNE